MKHKLIIFLVFYTSIVAFSQKVKELSYPQNYFMFPIRPGVTNHLSGTLGDLRSMHFHGGLDIKTEQRVGLPIYAAADGYVSEIRVSTGGYGNGLFIKHPNGYTTVYGHLLNYEGKIAEYCKIKRKELQTFEISIKPEANEIPIRKGQIIAISGNSGGSGGPHLHFEIRNEFNNLLNPLYFGFDEIKDNYSPQIQSFILKPLNIDSRVNKLVGRQYYYPKKTADGYKISTPILAKGEIAVELLAFDKMNYNNNSYGISCIEMFVNGEESFYYHLEKIPVEDSKDINVHIDYALEKIIGKKYQRLMLADGNDELPIYKPNESAGKLKIEPGKTYNIEIKTWDSYENLSKLSFEIFGDTTQNILNFKPNKLPESIEYQVDENTLIINLKNCKDPQTVCELGVNGKIENLAIQFIKNNTATYLYDLRKGLPQFIEVGGLQQVTNFNKTIFSNQKINLNSNNIKIRFKEKSLYDTLYLEIIDRMGSFQIGQATIPIKEPIDIEYVTSGSYNSKNSAVYNIYGNSIRPLNTEWEGKKAKFTARELGNFAILTDNIAPNIKPIVKDSLKLSFKINDELSGIKNFKVEVNGQFVLMDYDFKKDLIWSVQADTTEKYKGPIKLIVTDNAGNSAVYESTIEEELPVIKPKKSAKNRKYSKGIKSVKKSVKRKKSAKKKRKK